jgi:predicted dehydrogenase
MTPKIKTGIASYGMSGTLFHAPFIDGHPGFELSAVVERSKDEARKRYPHTERLRSFDELTADRELELIVVNTPDTTHYDFCRQALLAGKHVVVEKPFVFHAREGAELKKLAGERGLMLMVYQNRRWDSDFLTVKQVLDSGVLGRVMEFISAYERFRPATPGVSWKETAEGRRGTTYDLGSHIVDQIVHLFGMPQAVWATIERLRDGAEIDDWFQIQMLYPGFRATARAGFTMREAGPRFAVHGMKGSYHKMGLDVQEDALKRGERPGTPGWGAEPESLWGAITTLSDNGLKIRGRVESLPGNYFGFYDNVHAVLRAGAAPAVPLQESLDVIRILEAAFESNDTGRAVRVES